MVARVISLRPLENVSPAIQPIPAHYLLRIRWGNLNRLGSGERNLLPPKAAGRMSRDASESTWPQVGCGVPFMVPPATFSLWLPSVASKPSEDGFNSQSRALVTAAGRCNLPALPVLAASARDPASLQCTPLSRLADVGYCCRPQIGSVSASRWLGCSAAGHCSLLVWSSSRLFPIRASWLNGQKKSRREARATWPNLLEIRASSSFGKKRARLRFPISLRPFSIA